MMNYAVKHPGVPRLIVSAGDRLEAIQKYRKFAGILASEHETLVEDAGEDEVNSEPFPPVIGDDA